VTSISLRNRSHPGWPPARTEHLTATCRGASGPGQPDGGHAPAAQLTLQGIAVGERRAEPLYRIGHSLQSLTLRRSLTPRETSEDIDGVNSIGRLSPLLRPDLRLHLLPPVLDQDHARGHGSPAESTVLIMMNRWSSG